jgi:uncharacterized protein (TIGR00269 family)
MMCWRQVTISTMKRQFFLETHYRGRWNSCCGRARFFPRPLAWRARFYEREMTAYALLRGIEYIYDECPFAQGSTSIYYKEVLNQLENDRPGAKLTFYLRFLEARQAGLFIDSKNQTEYLHPCPNCGQPTSAPDMCSFCRLIDKVAEQQSLVSNL